MRFRAISPSLPESHAVEGTTAWTVSLAASSALQPDKQLMEAAQRGDRAAFASIIQRHQGAVYGYLRSRLLEPADAEDLSQEVFLRSYGSPAHFDHSVMVRPWLIGIARNLLREHVRRVKRRREVAWTELCLELEEMVGLQDERYDETIRHLPHCLASLGQSARQALDFRYQAKLRLSQIGEKLHRSEGAVKLLMFRARQALKHCLDTQTAQGNE
jgi:RNA polymerase sigma-70 factor (ECF subfamily)